MSFKQMSYVSVYDQSINNLHKTLAYCSLDHQDKAGSRGGVSVPEFPTDAMKVSALK